MAGVGKGASSRVTPRARIARALAAASALALLPACVMLETHGDRALPESERALVEGYWHYRVLYDEELHIVSVDGRREEGRSDWPYAYSVSLPSGRHWLQVALMRNSGEITRCAFDWTFEAQHRYKMQRVRHHQALLAHPTARRFAGSIEMAVTAPGGSVRQAAVPAVCGWGAMCRQDSDCPPKHACRMHAGFEFGDCVSRDR